MAGVGLRRDGFLRRIRNARGKELFHWADTYVLDIAREEDALLCLMIVLAIDAAKCSLRGRLSGYYPRPPIRCQSGALSGSAAFCLTKDSHFDISGRF